METKTCNKCGVDKPVSEYHRAARNVGGRYHTCKVCRKEIDVAYYQTSNKKERCREYKERNAERISKYKADRGCVFCQEKEPVALDFHHSDGKKEFTISSRRTLSWKRLLQEIEKCVVVCANCHRKLHAGLLKIY